MLRTSVTPSLFRFRAAACHSQPLCRRYESQDSTRKPVPWRQDTGVDQPSVLIEDHFTRSTLFTFDFFKRLAKFSLVGLFALGITGWTAFEGVHMWVEKVELAEDQDNEVRRWEWDRDAEKWSGGSIGGTDSALGFKARHAVRSAWIAQNWGTGSGASVIGSNAFTGRNPSAGSLNIIEARLEYAQNFLAIAVKVAEERMSTGSVRPQTMVELISRHAGILERMGTRDALFESRSQYERVWAGLPGKGIEAARTALKVGDLNYRLGDSEDALTWWARAINLTQGDGNRLPTINETPTVPESAPSSPSAQRTLISTLVSLSAYYSTSGQLKQAQSVQEASLSLLRSVPSPQSLASASHPQALHSLYLLHRSSLLSIHLAEVLYALRSPPQTSIQYLQRAAESSERVALALTGLPFSHPDAPGSVIPHPPASEAPLMASFQKSLAMRKPAKSLLRDARRSAAEAWNLIGVLSEGPDTGKAQGGEGMERALECYERALGWAGVAADQVGGIGEAGEGTPEAEWNLIWGNYVRAREAVRKQATKE